MSTLAGDRTPEGLVLLTTGGVAVLLHLALINVGLRAYQSVDTAQSPALQETTILARPLVVGGPKVVTAGDAQRVSGEVATARPETVGAEEKLSEVEAAQSLEADRVENAAQAVAAEQEVAHTGATEHIVGKQVGGSPVTAPPQVAEQESPRVETAPLAPAAPTAPPPVPRDTANMAEVAKPAPAAPQTVAPVASATVQAAPRATTVKPVPTAPAVQKLRPVGIAPPKPAAPIAAPVVAPPPPPAAAPEIEPAPPQQKLAKAEPEPAPAPDTVSEPLAEEPEAQPAKPVVQTPLRLQAEAPAAERLAVLRPTPVNPPTSSPEPMEPVQAPATEAQEGIAAPAENTPEDGQATAQAVYLSVLDFLKTYDGGGCFAALPSLSDKGGFQFETFARTRGALDDFRAGLERTTGSLPGAVMKPISASQCRALAFVQESANYPAFQLFFELPERQIYSGGQLRGRIGNLSGGFLTLLLVDDEGVVQNLESFLHFVPGAARFDIPMTVQGSPVETQQLLLALSTRTALQTVRTMSGQDAETFFSQLSLELLMSGQTEDIALVAFSVR